MGALRRRGNQTGTSCVFPTLAIVLTIFAGSTVVLSSGGLRGFPRGILGGAFGPLRVGREDDVLVDQDQDHDQPAGAHLDRGLPVHVTSGDLLADFVSL